MRFLRSFLFGVVLASAFFYFTTYRSGSIHVPSWVSRPQHVEITEAAGGESLDPEEQNNITVYRKNIGSVVNVTSR
ncbi:MAG: peptidase S1, partial [Terriglobales bacterium]